MVHIQASKKTFSRPLTTTVTKTAALGLFLFMGVLWNWHSNSSTLLRSSSSSSSRLQATPSMELSMQFQRPKTFSRSPFTLDEFHVAGVNLATYGLTTRTTNANKEPNNAAPFELFDSFNLRSQITGQESWVDLLSYRREVKIPNLSFYVDKIAQKRWLQQSPFAPIQVPITRPLVLQYASELTKTGEIPDEQNAMARLLPTNADYAAKVTHLSCSQGVWLIKTDANRTTWVGHGKKPLQPVPNFSNQVIVESLTQDLHKQQTLCNDDKQVPESWALIHVQPGILVEERLQAWDRDDRGGMEFKVFTIWGRVFVAAWRPGTASTAAFVHRNRTIVHWSKSQQALPDWLDWSRIVQMAETLGAHKDMFRTDIFVGIPAGSTSKEPQYLVSETEIHPTPLKHTEEIFEEAGRLWLAGYAMGKYRVVPDTEVPKEFVETGRLSAVA